MKKVLIISPIVNYGGRELEVNIIAKSLQKDFKLTIMSTHEATLNSQALNGLKEVAFYNLKQKITKDNIFLNIMAYSSYLWNNRKGKVYNYLINSISKKTVNFKTLKLKTIKKELVKHDFLWIVGDFDTPFLIETIDTASKYNIPCIFRTTRTIYEENASFLKQIVDKIVFVHHSLHNANRLTQQIKHDYKIIDQCALNESILLEEKIETGNEIRYGFLGRLVEGKGVKFLVDFYSKSENKFIVAGYGALENYVLAAQNSNSNIKYLGKLEHENTKAFFKEIDVLIISSTEESGPLVALEAMAAGKIVVSTRVGAMPERLKNIYQPFWLDKDLNNLMSLTTEINNLPIKTINELKVTNREVYIKDYSLAKTKDQYLKLTNEILNNKINNNGN